MKILIACLPAIADTVVKATILLGLAWIAGLVLKNRSAALRHTVRACALAAVLLLPVLSYLVPAWHWQSLEGFYQFLMVEKQSAATGELPAALPKAPESNISSIELASARPAARAATTAPNYQLIPSAISKSRFVINWPQILIAIWLLGIVLVAFRLLLGRSRFALLLRRAAAVDDHHWHSQVQEIARLLGIRRPVALLRSEDTEVPLTSGALHPKIILSPDHAEWSPLRRNAILHHELAHIRRLDALAQALCHIAIAMYWFHPLVWLTVKAMRAEREQACDDYVLASGTKPSEYAHELLEIASALRQPEFIAALAMARRSQLEGRVMALLNPALRRESISQRTTLIAALLTLCAVLPLAAIQTAAPQQKSSKSQTKAIPKPSPSKPAATTEAEPPDTPEPPEPLVAPVAPPLPAAATPPAGGVLGGVPGGVKEGVPGGVQAVPPMPPAPASPQAVPSAPALPATRPRLAPPPALPKAPAVAPVPPVAPLPPVPDAAPVAPATPSTPPAGAAPAAPKANAAPHPASTASALAELRAQLAAMHAQADGTLADQEALRARIAAATASSVHASVAAAQRKAQIRAAVDDATSNEMAILRARLATLAATTAQTARAQEIAALRVQIAALAQAASLDNGAGSCVADLRHANKKTITRITTDETHKRWTADWPDQKCRMDFHSQGSITFNQQGDIESISPEGFLELSEKNGDTLREVKVTPSTQGLQFVFRVNGVEQPFDDGAKAWFSSLLRTAQQQLALPKPVKQ